MRQITNHTPIKYYVSSVRSVRLVLDLDYFPCRVSVNSVVKLLKITTEIEQRHRAEMCVASPPAHI